MNGDEGDVPPPLEPSTPDVVREKLPKRMWHSLVFKVLLGFDLHIRKKPETYLNENYIRLLIEQERDRKNHLQRSLTGLYILTALSLLYLENFSAAIPSTEIDFLSVPIVGEVLCVLLGLNIFATILVFLDVYIISRMKNWIAQICGTDVPATFFAQYTSDGLWGDLFIPKVFGYQSTRSHSIVARLVMVIILLFILAIVLIPYSVLVAVFVESIHRKPFDWSFSAALQLTGLCLGTAALIVGTLATLAKFPFERPEDPDE